MGIMLQKMLLAWVNKLKSFYECVFKGDACFSPWLQSCLNLFVIFLINCAETNETVVFWAYADQIQWT